MKLERPRVPFGASGQRQDALFTRLPRRVRLPSLMLVHAAVFADDGYDSLSTGLRPVPEHAE